MGNLALIHRESAQGLVQAGPDDSGLRYVHVYDEPFGIESRTQKVRDLIAERDWTQKFFSGMAFVDVSAGQELKQRIEEELRRIVHRDNPFTDLIQLENLLDSTVYMLSEAPRMIHLPADSAAAVSKAGEADPDVLRYLSDAVMHQFLGNAYSMDWENMVGVGERLKLTKLYEKFPEACRRVFGDIENPGDVTQISIKRRDKHSIHRAFYMQLTQDDIPALLELLDGEVAQTYANRALQGEWEHLASDYEGVSYTDRVDNLDGTPQQTWPAHEIHRDWAGAHAVKIGTVMELLQMGAIKWPGPRPGTEDISAWRHPIESLRRAWHQQTKDEKRMAEYEAGIAALLRDEYGVTTLPAPSGNAAKLLPGG
jgi:hypothetical protein